MLKKFAIPNKNIHWRILNCLCRWGHPPRQQPVNSETPNTTIKQIRQLKMHQKVPN